MLSSLRPTALGLARFHSPSTRFLSSYDLPPSGENDSPIPPPLLPSSSHLPADDTSTATPQQVHDTYTHTSASAGIQASLDIPPESDPLLAYLTSHLMRDGKRHAAARRTSRMLLHLHALTRAPPLPLFREAIALASPSIRIVSHKKGGKNLQKPVPLGEKQRTRFAIKWMLQAADSQRGRTIEERLARGVLDILKGTEENNEVLKKKQAVHFLGMVNRANAK